MEKLQAGSKNSDYDSQLEGIKDAAGMAYLGEPLTSRLRSRMTFPFLPPAAADTVSTETSTIYLSQLRAANVLPHMVPPRYGNQSVGAA